VKSAISWQANEEGREIDDEGGAPYESATAFRCYGV